MTTHETTKGNAVHDDAFSRQQSAKDGNKWLYMIQRGVVLREMWKEGTTAWVTILLYSKLMIAHFITLSLNDYILDYDASAFVASISAMGVTVCKGGARKRQRG